MNVEERSPVLRRKSRSEELEQLHPAERYALRVFEFLASIKLAVILLFIFMIELIIGTLLESNFNAPVSKFFIYNSYQFKILVALLGLNVLCAALIRFPWKRYQTGFVITHCGLLTMIVAFYITSNHYMDCHMNAPKEMIVDTIFDTNQDVLEIREWELPKSPNQENFDAWDRLEKKQRSDFLRRMQPKISTLDVDFGPFTWGAKTLFGNAYWRGIDGSDTFTFSCSKSKPYEMKLKPLENKDEIVVKRFLANSERGVYLKEDEAGEPGIEFWFASADRGKQHRSFLLDEDGFVSDREFEQRFGIPINVFRADSTFELNHQLSVKPSEESGANGTVVISYIDQEDVIQNQIFRTEDLLETPVQLKGTEYWIKVADFYEKAAMPASPTDPFLPVGEGKDGTPGINVYLGTTKELDESTQKFPIFGDFSGFNARIQKNNFQWKDLLIEFIPPLPQDSIDFFITRSGNAVYRYQLSGNFYATNIEVGQSYPSFAVFEMIPLRILGKAVREVRAVPKPLPQGTTDGVVKAIQIEYTDGDRSKTLWVTHNDEPSESEFRFGNKVYRIRYKYKEYRLPMALRMDAFDQPENPGTSMAAAYQSYVTLFPEDGSEKEIDQYKIYMNHPLRHRIGSEIPDNKEEDDSDNQEPEEPFDPKVLGREFTFYQSNIQFFRTETGKEIPVSGYTVASDPGLWLMYIGAQLLSFGIFLMFYMGGYFRLRSQKQPQGPVPSDAMKVDTYQLESNDPPILTTDD